MAKEAGVWKMMKADVSEHEAVRITKDANGCVIVSLRGLDSKSQADYSIDGQSKIVSTEHEYCRNASPKN